MQVKLSHRLDSIFNVKESQCEDISEDATRRNTEMQWIMGDCKNLLQYCCFRQQAILVIGQRRATLPKSTFLKTKGSR